jgi:hypothetical protein
MDSQLDVILVDPAAPEADSSGSRTHRRYFGEDFLERLVRKNPVTEGVAEG